MAKTLIFKKEHEKKLKDLKLKTEFSNEVRRSFSEEKGRDGLVIKDLDSFMSIQKNMSWSYFIGNAFNWEKTERNYLFWEEVSRK